MMPIRDLLDKILWDTDFGRGEFTLGYYDRVADKIILVPWSRLRLEQNHRLSLLDESGVERHIPLHRVREVYENGTLIWQRPRPAHLRQ